MKPQEIVVTQEPEDFQKLHRIYLDVFSFNLVWFEKFGYQGYLSNLKLAIEKQGVTDWLGNNKKKDFRQPLETKTF